MNGELWQQKIDDNTVKLLQDLEKVKRGYLVQAQRVDEQQKIILQVLINTLAPDPDKHYKSTPNYTHLVEVKEENDENAKSLNPVPDPAAS